MKKKILIFLFCVAFLSGILTIGQQPLIKPITAVLADLKNVSITTPTDGQVLKYVSSTGLWTPGTGSAAGMPAGSDTQIQYNSSGIFGADANFVTDKAGNITLVSVNASTAVVQAYKAEYNITSQLGAWVHGVKVELTRAADIQPTTGCWFGGQFVLNAGSSGYTALDKPAYVLQAVFKGSDTNPNGTDQHVGRFETQSAGKVSDIVHVLANTGTTIIGSLEYIATHVAPGVSMLNINAQSSVTVPIGIKIMDGAGSSYNYGIDMGSATINTADIVLQNSETIKNTTDGEIEISGNLILPSAGHVGYKAQSEARFYDSDNSHYVGWKAQGTSGTQIWSLPTADGSNGQVLRTNGGGVLGWASAAAGAGTFELDDTNASNVLTGSWNEDDDTDRAFYFEVNGGDRTLDLAENFKLLDGQDLELHASGGEKAQLAIDTQNAERTLDLSANLTVESTSIVNQDLTSDASPTFATPTVTGLKASGADLLLQDDAAQNVDLFASAASGETPAFTVSGYKSGDSRRAFSLAVGSVANDTATITGLSNYTFDGTLGIGIGVSPSSILHIKANVPGTVGSHPAGQLIIQDPDDSVLGNAVITGYESDGSGNPHNQLWYLGSSSVSNSDIEFRNRRNSKLSLGTNDTIRMTIESGGTVTFTGLISTDTAIATAIDIGNSFTGSQVTMTGSSATDHAIEIDGSFSAAVIYTHTSSATADTLLWGDMATTVTTGDVNGLRPRLAINAASGDVNARAVYGEVIVGASKFAGLATGVLAHVSYAAGDATIIEIATLVSHTSQGSGLIDCDNLYGIKATVQTRGDEAIADDDYVMRLDNEAVGGNGRQMDGAIQIINTSMGGGTDGFGYGIDMSEADIATADIVLQNGEVIKNITDGTLEYTGWFGEDLYDNGNSGSAITIDWKNGNFQKVTLTAAGVDITFTEPDTAGPCVLYVYQDGTGSRTIDWEHEVSPKWPGDVEPTLTTAANSWDIFGGRWDGTNYAFIFNGNIS